jgi:hypothetical protein
MRAPVLAILALAACDGGATSDPGYGAKLQIAGAQYRPGPLPTANGGPDAIQLTTEHGAITIGDFHEPLSAVLGPGTSGVVIGVQGSVDGWILPADVPAFDTPNDPGLSAIIGVADDFPPGPFSLVLYGVDPDGHYGHPITADLTADLSPPPDGMLLVGLDWEGTADLDLHVVDPLGGEAYSGNPNTYQPPPPGDPPDPPDAYLAGGILDRDANQNCHRDGRPAEHVIWTMPPPAGAYVVRVEARNMCGDASEAWEVSALHNGVLIGASRGVATDDEVQLLPHGQGAGVLALQFTL